MVRQNLQKCRQPAGTKTKVVEGNGSKSGHLLVRTNQFPREVCHREKCVLCAVGGGQGKKTKCDKSNVGYEGKCVRCVETPHIYVGETSHTGYTRVSQHLADFRAASIAKLPPLPTDNLPNQIRKRPPRSWMWEHVRDVHHGLVGEGGGHLDFQFTVKNKFTKCLQRQVDEDIRMKLRENEGCVLLNSKNEYFTPKSVEVIFKQL